MNLVNSKFLTVFVGFFLCACQSTINVRDVIPLSDKSIHEAVSVEERQLIKRSSKLHKKFVNKGLIVRNDKFTTYIEQIAKKIAPKFLHSEIKLNFYIFKDPSINAFALPNGNIYLNTGLIGQLTSEDQLAYILGHEIAHVVERHGLIGLIDRKNVIVTSHVLDLMTFGTGLVYLATITELSSHNRKLEDQADLQGLRYLARSNYKLTEAISAFKRLESSKYPKESFSIWSNHPDISKRIKNIKGRLAKLNVDFSEVNNLELVEVTQLNGISFDDIRQHMAKFNFSIRLRNKQFELAEEIAKEELQRSPNEALNHYNLGEVNRLKVSEPEAYLREYAWLHDKSNNKKLKAKLLKEMNATESRALKYYERAIEIEPSLNIVNKGKGLLALHLKQIEQAKRYLNTYVLGSEVSDRRYIESIIKNL